MHYKYIDGILMLSRYKMLDLCMIMKERIIEQVTCLIPYLYL